MTITVETIATLTPVDYAVTACALSGDWIVAADNVGTSLLRYNVATDTAYETTSWRSGSQTLSSCAVRPNGNVCFFRYNGSVYEVDPTDGSTTDWSAGGNLGHIGQRPVEMVGEVAYFGGYGIGGGSSTIYAVKLNLSTQTRTQLSSVGTGTSAWYRHSIADDLGNVWLTRTGVDPWRIVVSSDSMSQPAGTMGSADAHMAPFRFGSYIWHGSSTVNKITQLDPSTDTLSLVDTVTGTFGSTTANSRVIQAHDRGDGTVQAIVRRISGADTYTGGMQFTPNGAVVDESTADSGWWSSGGGANASVSQGRYIYTWLGSSLQRLTFNPIGGARQRIGLGWMVA